MTNREILLDLWKKVNECEEIPFSENSYLNEDNENMMLLDDLVMISIIDGAVIMSYSSEMYNPHQITSVYDFIYKATGIRPLVADSYYIFWDEEKEEMEMLFGEEADNMALKDRCMHVFKDLLQNKNMRDFLEDLDIEEMHKC